MEADGMIEREVRGRRTFRITLKDDWGLTERRPALRPVPTTPAPEHDDELSDIGGVDLGLLADVLLQRVIKRATEQSTVPSSTQVKQLADRLKRAESSLEVAQRQLRDVQAERRELERQVASLKETNTALENNLALMQRELAKPRRGGVPIRERLSDSERAMLDNLMRALPESPTSKPRPAKRTR